VLQEGSPVENRLHGIDCPESAQDFGSRAKSFTSELAFGRVVTVRPVGTDRYERTVAEVVLPDGRFSITRSFGRALPGGIGNTRRVTRLLSAWRVKREKQARPLVATQSDPSLGVEASKTRGSSRCRRTHGHPRLRRPAPLSRDFCYGFAADRIVLTGRKSRISSSLNGKNPNRS
jgi:Staphylococcal nuclease homologue